MPQTEERRKQYTNICVEVTRDIQKRLTEKAKINGLTRSEIVRKLISDYLAIGEDEK